MSKSSTTAVVTAAFLASCTFGQGYADPPSDPNMISYYEILRLEDVEPNAYDLIRRIRPQWLQSRGASFVDSYDPRTFVDEAPYGELSDLRRIPTLTIREIQFYDGRDATTQYGTGYPGGVIHVRTRP